MKKIIIILVGVFLMAGCQASEDKPSITKISGEVAKEMMNDEVLVIDVRTIEEYGQGYIPGAQLLPLDSIKAGELDLLADKEQTILLYCRSGNRSGQAAKLLADAGYTNIYDFGGIIDWKYEVVQ